jgi:hypothetical protein
VRKLAKCPSDPIPELNRGAQISLHISADFADYPIANP